MNASAEKMLFIYTLSRGKISHSEFPTPANYTCILFKKGLHICRMNGILAHTSS